MTCAIALITDVLFGTATTVVTSVGAFSMFALLWYALPLRRRFRYRRGGSAASAIRLVQLRQLVGEIVDEGELGSLGAAASRGRLSRPRP